MSFAEPVHLNPDYLQLIYRFKQWLIALGYCDQTVYILPQSIIAMLYYFESVDLFNPKAISNDFIKLYYDKLKQRPNKRTGEALSPNTLNKELQAIYKFSEFLNLNQITREAALEIPREKKKDVHIDILTIDEITALFKLGDNFNPKSIDFAIFLRNRAMLSIFYSCALRRNEGYHLDIDDILLDENMIYVKHGKNNTERLVPITEASKNNLLAYLEIGRPMLCTNNRQRAFFLNYRSRRLNGQSFLNNLKKMIQNSGVQSMMNKKIGIHSLRHSIASHLLENGVSLKKIALFLGHKSLESTQIYTHLIHESNELSF
jgi:integrase/recombinase XerD